MRLPPCPLPHLPRLHPFRLLHELSMLRFFIIRLNFLLLSWLPLLLRWLGLSRLGLVGSCTDPLATMHSVEQVRVEQVCVCASMTC